MSTITKKGAFKIFWYMTAADGSIGKEELDKLDEIGFQIFGDDYTNDREKLISECQSVLSNLPEDPSETYVLLTEYINDAISAPITDGDTGITPRHLVWNLMLMAFSDGEFEQNEQRLLRFVTRKLEVKNSIVLEMEQYIRTVLAIEKELDLIKDSMEPYKLIRPIADELENRENTIKQAVLDLIEDEMIVPVEKLTLQDDIIDKTQAAIRAKTDPTMKKLNEQAGKLFGDVKKAATPAAAEAGKKLGKAFMGLGSKLMGKQSSDTNEQ